MKKIIFSSIIIACFFIFLELSARTYHFIKYKDPSVYSYGFNILKSSIRELFQGQIKTDIYKYKDIKDKGDEAFAGRGKMTDEVEGRKPFTTLVWGYMDRINNFGLRGSDVSLKKPEGVKRIMMLGGSFVFCVGVGDEDTWESVLQRRLDKEADGRYEVINAGRGSSTIDHIFLNLIEHDIRFDPDYVFLVSAYNNHTLLRSETRLSVSWRLSKFLYNISQFYAMLREKIAIRVYKEGNYFLYNYNIHVKPEEVDRLLKKYRDQLSRILTICEENNAKLIVGTQPELMPRGLTGLQNMLDENKVNSLNAKLRNNEELSYYEFEYYLQAMLNKEMEKFALDNGLLLFDGVGIFPKDKHSYFVDEIHLNQKGTVLFADRLFEFFVKNNIAKVKAR
ncbi:MAG: SGNH/GDSL hydrolase family protein [Candidatus Omnitrophica bacterium]|nr:SGNH/GDSL hydrolase family protein [Candidatus Omnitrophota bacterium]